MRRARLTSSRPIENKSCIAKTLERMRSSMMFRGCSLWHSDRQAIARSGSCSTTAAIASMNHASKQLRSRSRMYFAASCSSDANLRFPVSGSMMLFMGTNVVVSKQNLTRGLSASFGSAPVTIFLVAMLALFLARAMQGLSPIEFAFARSSSSVPSKSLGLRDDSNCVGSLRAAIFSKISNTFRNLSLPAASIFSSDSLANLLRNLGSASLFASWGSTFSKAFTRETRVSNLLLRSSEPV
mmetsp:Transcript_12496/g.24372  ORF Transcript_12496/g.24372 Transcript_12496/m.24372 type:complete len:240 (-) Transcript_12496:168-887(-)